MSCVAHPLNDDAAPCHRCGAPYCDDCLVVLRNERLCAGCKDDVLRDVISGTAGGRKPLARLTPRLAAYVIDRAIFYAFVAGFVYVWALVGRLGIPTRHLFIGQMAMMAVLYAGFAIYEALMLISRGQTVGKMAVGVRVVRADGTPITRRQAWGRAIVRSVFLSAWYTVAMIHGSQLVVWLFVLTLIDPLVALITPQRTALHDLAARTRVYRTE